MDGGHIAEDRLLESDEKVFEFFLNHLRLREPFGPGDFTSRTGLAWVEAAETVDQAVRKGLLEPAGNGYRHTPVGWRFINDLQALFLPPENR